MKAADFFTKYEAFCPKELAEAGDPVGLQIGSLDQDLQKILVTLDIREQTVEEAIELGVDAILAKHPVIFRPLENLTTADSQEAIVLKLAQAGIAVYTSHSNIDIVEGGLNDWFCEELDIKGIKPLTVEGLGRVGEVELQPLSVFVETAKRAFRQDRLRLVTYDHSQTQLIHRVAICGGSGGKFWPQAKSAGADLYITADIYYHTAHDLLSSGLMALDPGHYMERLFVPKVAQVLRKLGTDVRVLESQALTNPFYDI